MTNSEFEAFITGLYPKPSEENKRAHTLWSNRLQDLRTLYRYAETNDFGRGTRWAAYNAVTEYLDWGIPVRSATRDADTQRAMRQLGEAHADAKAKAFALLAA